MSSIFPPLKSKPRFPLDLSLLPAGIIFLESAALLTELSRMKEGETTEVVLVRVIHTVILFVLAKIANRVISHRKIVEVSYSQIFAIGVMLSGLAEIARMLLTALLNVSEDYSSHRFFIVLVHGLFWIPVFVIVGGRLTEIFSVFKDYEKRLLIKTRINIRTSLAFKREQEVIQDEIRKNLKREATAVLKALAISNRRSNSLSDRNKEIQPHLVGLNLRALSFSLENKLVANSETTVFGQNVKSLSMLSKQFTLLYKLTARKSPLTAWVYTIVSSALVAPTMINFFSITRVLASWPPLFLATYLVAKGNERVLRKNGEHSIAISNLLIVLLGFLPFIANRIGQIISPNPDTKFSFLLAGAFFAFGYYIFIRFIQITQPAAIASISNDELQASPALEEAVSKIVSAEFSQAISHRWAVYIHGKILTRLAATSLKLEQAVNANDADRFDAGIERAKTLLADPTQEFEDGFSDVQTEVASRLDPWAGLINISIKIDPALAKVANSRVRDFGEAIEEIISNSVRHGGSQNISIDVTQMAHPDIQIKVEDDATNPLPFVVSRIGLGTRILNLVSDGRWSISHEGQKTTVIMTVSLLEV